MEEVIKIEKAFESNTEIHKLFYWRHSKEEVRKDQINGLKAVVEVMMTFDDCKENINEVFTSKAELIPIN